MSSFIACKDSLLLIPDGKYEAVYDYHETWNYMGKSPKVTFWFKVVTIGEYFGILIPRYFNVKRIIGKPAKYGRFAPGRSSDFLLEYCGLFPRKITRLDRIPLSLLEQDVISVLTRTVTNNRQQRHLPEVMQYSVISRWLSVIER